jgi:hypothetical protein
MIPVRALAASTLVGLSAVTGCLPGQTAGGTVADNTPRGQVADDAADAAKPATIGQKTVVGNTEPVTVSGVGLVSELRGTGSSPQPDGFRTALETAIRKKRGNPRDLLDDPAKSTSLVLVSAQIPPGARPGDRLDVSVTLPAGSRTASLKGGALAPCDLSNHELAGTLRQQMGTSGGTGVQDSAVLSGHQLAEAEGPLLAGRVGPKADGAATDDGPRAGVIWGGGRNKLPRPYYLLLEDANPQPRLAMVIAERLNAVFHVPGDGGHLAEAKVQGSRPLVTTFVPPMYRLNHGRFLLVARHVPLNPVAPDSPYRKQLEADLLRPETAIVAAVKLEALGADSKQPLRVGLQSDNPWVKFAAAESLAYLGHADGARELAAAAERHPALRTHALLALASLDDAPCVDKLTELMAHKDPAVRYGAFHALRSADPNHPAVRGRKAGGYTLHQVPGDGPPLVHVSADRRCEVALFGSGWPLRGPLSLSLGTDCTVTLKDGDKTATVTRVATKNGEPVGVERKCPADAGAVLAALAELGAGFPEAAEFVKRAQAADAVACGVEFDAAPRGLSVQQLVTIARSDPSIERADLEVQRAGQAVVQAGYDLPGTAESIQAKPPAPALPPNRDPGRLLGDPDPSAASLNKEPGRLFGKK